MISVWRISPGKDLGRIRSSPVADAETAHDVVDEVSGGITRHFFAGSLVGR